VAKNLAIHVLLTYIIQIKFAKYRLSTLGRGLREMAHISVDLFLLAKYIFVNNSYLFVYSSLTAKNSPTVISFLKTIVCKKKRREQ
jgi:hypothetical protein